MYYNKPGKQITRTIVVKALNRLGDLLENNNKRLERVCCGGAVSVLYHRSRKMTHDVDVLFPNDPNMTNLLKNLLMRWVKNLG